jgi:hypothetical protein
MLYNDNGENNIARKYSLSSFLANLGGKDIPKMNNIKQILQMYNPYLYDLFRKVKHEVVNSKL